MDAEPPLTSADAFALEARRFADSLSDTVQTVAGPAWKRFRTDVSTEQLFEATVREEDDEGILLSCRGVPLLRLEVRIWLVSDHAQQHLKVDKSQFRVFPEGGRVPVFRYEYDSRNEGGRLPAAHVQFHGEHTQLAELMQSAGVAATRSSPRQGGPNIADLHFPVGGSRFRPCLEDVLEMLIREFDIDPRTDRAAVLKSLAEGRAAWRNLQLRSAIRDDPRSAAEVLRQLGYQVHWLPGYGEPSPRTNRLRGI